MSAFTRHLQQDTQTALLNKLRGSDIFLLVDGGTLNRKRLLNACLGWNGETYFYKSVRVPNLTAMEVRVFVVFSTFKAPSVADCLHIEKVDRGPCSAQGVHFLCGRHSQLTVQKFEQQPF